MENDLNNLIICCIFPSAVLISRKLMSKLVLKALLIPFQPLIYRKLMPRMEKCSPPSR